MELLNGGSICRKNLLVSYFDCDMHNKMKLSALLRQVQQISMEHCDLLGIGDQFLGKLGLAFLLGRLSVKIFEMPSATDKLVITTLPDSEPMRAQYKRATYIRTLDDKPLIEVDARWILVEMNTQKILRTMPEDLVFPKHHIETFLHDVKVPKKDTLLGSCETTVSYSHLDVNHHMNNTYYADIICNSICNVIEDSPIMEKSPSALIINYKNQALKGDTITSCVYTCASDKNTYCVEGSIGEKTCFDSSISFNE